MEVTGVFICYPVGPEEMKIVINLQALTLIDNPFRKVSDYTLNDAYGPRPDVKVGGGGTARPQPAGKTDSVRGGGVSRWWGEWFRNTDRTRHIEMKIYWKDGRGGQEDERIGSDLGTCM